MNLWMADDVKSNETGDGWERQGVTIPKQVWVALRGLAGKRGHGSMKVITTAGLSVVAGMPEHARERLLRWIAITEWDHGPAALTPEAVWQQLLEVIREDIGNARVIGPVERAEPPAARLEERPLPTEETHEVTRILDPRILGRKKKAGEDAA